MTAGQRQRGVTALLFDRLMTRERAGEGSATIPPCAIYDLEGLRDSIAEQLGWLLNTRVPIDYSTLDARTRTGMRSTVDYGLPDLTVYPVGETEARAMLHDHLCQTIALYEPRLRDPRVRLSPIGEGRDDVLVAEVSGQVRIGMIVTPIAFTLRLDPAKRPDRGG